MQEPEPLRVLRARHLLSVRELARLADVSPMTVLNVELKRFRPTSHTMRSVAAALGCEVSEVEEFAAALDYRATTYKTAA